MAYRSTPVPVDLPAALRRVVETFIKQIRLARHGRPRAIHESRVASRRLRELLPVVVADAQRRKSADLRRAVRRLARALGRVRELDVALDLVARHPQARAWPRGVRPQIARELERERTARQEKLVARMDRRVLADLARRLRAVTQQVRSQRSAATEGGIAERRRRRARSLRRALQDAGTVYQPALLHAVRIATKKLRYNLEWSRASSGPGLAAQLAELKATQQLLGEIQDLHTLETRLRRLAADSTMDRTTVRALHIGAIRLEAACRERHAQFVKLIPRLTALAADLARKTPLEWIRRRPARMPLGAATGTASQVAASGRDPKTV